MTTDRPLPTRPATCARCGTAFEAQSRGIYCKEPVCVRERATERQAKRRARVYDWRHETVDWRSM